MSYDLVVVLVALGFGVGSGLAMRRVLFRSDPRPWRERHQWGWDDE